MAEILPVLQKLEDVGQWKARIVDGCDLPKPPMIAISEWTLNLAGVPPVSMAGLVTYLMDVCNWKDDAMCHYQQSNGYQLFDKANLHNV